MSLLGSCSLKDSVSSLISSGNDGENTPKTDTPSPKDDSAPEARVKMVAEIVNLGTKIEVAVLQSEYTFGNHLVITSDATDFIGRNGEKITKSDLKVGDKVEILYGGQVMMSLPPQIVASKITVISD